MAHDLDTVRSALAASRARLQPQAHVVATGVGYKTTRGVRSDVLSIEILEIGRTGATG